MSHNIFLRIFFQFHALQVKRGVKHPCHMPQPNVLQDSRLFRGPPGGSMLCKFYGPTKSILSPLTTKSHCKPLLFTHYKISLQTPFAETLNLERLLLQREIQCNLVTNSLYSSFCNYVLHFPCPCIKSTTLDGSKLNHLHPSSYPHFILRITFIMC